jgi:hypothetical protein
VPCGGCDWSDEVLAGQAREVLADFSIRSSRCAYRPGGCWICPECRNQFGRDMRSCPLRLITRCALDDDPLPTRHRPGLLLHLGALLALALRQRDYPETVEIYWRRLLPWFANLIRRSGSRREGWSR